MDKDELLIESVKGYPCLYDSKSKVSLKKENAWTAIALCIKDATNAFIVAEDCSRRWKALRERYVKELKKKNTKSGQGVTVCVPWELFRPREFIHNFMKHRKSDGNMTVANVQQLQQQGDLEVVECAEDQQTEEDDMAHTSPSTSTLDEPSPCPRKRAKRLHSPDAIEKEIFKELKRAHFQEKDKDDLFGQNIRASLKKMTPEKINFSQVKNSTGHV